jgi:hypothetical protein
VCRRGRAAAVVEVACVHGIAAMAAKEAGSSSIDGAGGDQRSREHAVGTLRVLGQKVK